MKVKIQMKNFKLRRTEEGGLERSVVSGRSWVERDERRCRGGPKERISGQSAPSGEGTANCVGQCGGVLMVPASVRPASFGGEFE